MNSHIMTTVRSEHLRHHPRNPADYIVLGVVAIHPTHGYEIVKIIQTELNSIWKLKKGRIYAILDKLERDGLLEVLKVDQDKAPARKVFTLTESGQSAFSGWMKFQDPKIKHMRIELLGKVFFALRSGGDHLRALLLAQLEVCEAKAERLRLGMRDEPDGIGRLALSYRLNQVEASIRWIKQTCSKHIRELGGAGVDAGLTDDFSLEGKGLER